MDFVKKRLSSSRAAWKVIANQVMIMPTLYPGGDYIGFDSWQGYPGERRSCSSTSVAAGSRTSCS